MPLRLVLVLFCLGAALLCVWKYYDIRSKLPTLPPDAHALSVRQFGAVGDGTTKDTAAFQRALDAAAQRGGGVVDVNDGTYLLGSIVIPSRVTLNLEPRAVLQGSDDPADYPVVPGRWEGVEAPVHQALISASGATDIAITGSGTIQGAAHVGKLRDPRGPCLIEFTSCRQVRIEGRLVLKNYHVWTVHPLYCQDVVISGISFSTRGRSADGLDPDSSRNVGIDHCIFATSDDCISVKSGRGLAGQKMSRPSEDITISDCRFDRGIGCIALGSELSGGIRRVTIRDCIFNGGLSAVYIKTNEARGGFLEDVTAAHLRLTIPLLRIDTHYSFRATPNDITGAPGLTAIRHLRFANIRVQSNQWIRSLLAWFRPKLRPGNLVDVEGDEQIPIDGLSFAGIDGYTDRGLVIENVHHLQLEDVHVKCAFTPMLSLSRDETDSTPSPVILEDSVAPAR